MIYLEAYKDFVDNGSFNKISEIDDDWVLKTPLKVGENDQDGFDNMKIILSTFDEHIRIMKKYTEVFPKVKRLDRYRAAVERLDTKKAIEEIAHVYSYIKPFFKQDMNIIYFMNYILESDDLMRLLYKGDNICKRWYNFFNMLRMHDIPDEIGIELDLHDDNFGIDKKGNIRLLDF